VAYDPIATVTNSAAARARRCLRRRVIARSYRWQIAANRRFSRRASESGLRVGGKRARGYGSQHSPVITFDPTGAPERVQLTLYKGRRPAGQIDYRIASNDTRSGSIKDPMGHRTAGLL
jgi:hypothetical protein